MGKYIINIKKHKYYSILMLLLLLLTFSAIVAFAIVDDIEQNKLQREWSIISKYIDRSVEEAHKMNNTNVGYVQRKINEEYKNDTEQLEVDLKEIEKINPLTLILYESIVDDFIYGLDSNHTKDNNDPFYMNWVQILVDLSINCSGEYGITRTHEQEVDMHFNQNIAKLAINNIKDERVEYAIWHYLEINKELPYYEEVKKLKYVDKQVLRELFFKYNGDYRVLRGFEFLVPKYVYREVDLAGNPTVTPNGFQNENYRIILVQGFNIIDVLDEFEHLDRIINTKHDIEIIRRKVYLSISIFTLAWLIGFAVLYKRKHDRR